MVPKQSSARRVRQCGTLAVFPESDTKFFSKPWPTQFEFSKNEHGEFTILKRYQDGAEETGAKN